MMYPYSAEACLHMTFVSIALVGAVLFVLWAKDNLNKKQLLQLAVGLILLGVLGALLVPGLFGAERSPRGPLFGEYGNAQLSPELDVVKEMLGTS